MIGSYASVSDDGDLALSAFGGGLSALSQRIVVEPRRWLTSEQFMTGRRDGAFAGLQDPE